LHQLSGPKGPANFGHSSPRGLGGLLLFRRSARFYPLGMSDEERSRLSPEQRHEAREQGKQNRLEREKMRVEEMRLGGRRHGCGAMRAKGCFFFLSGVWLLNGWNSCCKPLRANVTKGSGRAAKGIVLASLNRQAGGGVICVFRAHTGQYPLSFRTAVLTLQRLQVAKEP